MVSTVLKAKVKGIGYGFDSHHLHQLKIDFLKIFYIYFNIENKSTLTNIYIYNSVLNHYSQ